MFLKRGWIIFIVTQLFFTKGFSQDCSVNFFAKSYTGWGFNTGGSQGDKLTILPDSSMIICNSLLIARIYKNTEVAWSKSLYSFGGNTSNAIADYDGGIVCVMGNNIIKFDTLGNIIYQKKTNFNIDNGHDVTYSESFRDIAMLENGDKMVLYEDVSGRYGGYLIRYDRDMTVIKWCKNLRFNDNINFTNMVIDGGKIVLAGICKEFYFAAPVGFLASVDAGNGNLIRTGYFDCANLGGLRNLYKGDGQYFLTGNLINQTYAEGSSFYIRIDSLFNVLAIRRIVGYTDNFSTTISFVAQSDNSFYGIIGRGFTATIFNIDKQDSIKWFQGYLIGGYPHDVKQNTEGLFFAADWDYNAVGVGARSTFTICKTDFNGNIGNNCMPKVQDKFVTNNYNFSKVTPASTLQITDKVCTIGTGNVTLNNYPLSTLGCSYNSVCNSIKLIGDTSVCNGLPVLFTARRNSACNSRVNWTISPQAAYTVVNDSVISINFPANGNYKIISKINDRCNVYSDSMNVHVNLSGLLDMPDDSILCEGNTIKLSPGNQFKTYQWQDGSADSFFVVKQPGKYFITVKDYCGKMYSDTINISAANYYFKIGNDTAKCNSDSLILKATGGFYNYVWRSQYNLTAVNDSTVIVNPMVDTIYIATAEKKPGCFVKDTIHIAVLNSPPIFLGNDTSLCTGQFLLLDAGNGFSKYNWSTGDVSKKVTVNDAGTYSIKATAANGCSSADAIKILKVNPLPHFTLGADTILCEGQNLSYNFNLPNATYLWNNGNILNTKIIQNPGLYWLSVTEQGCSSTDTINVFYKPAPIVQLGRDTVLCDGVALRLDAFNNNATYLWQDKSTLSSYLVKTTGVYNVLVDINGCKANDSVNITYKSKPAVSLVKETTICSGQEILLQPLTNTNDKYLWQDGSINISLKVKKAGTYILSASNECGITTSTANVFLGTCELNMPTAFTPNNDGLNDLFRVKNIFAVEAFSFIIYNKFGEVVFASNSINNGWNGSYKGTAQNAGAYVWIISFIDSNNIKKIAQGTVLLLR